MDREESRSVVARSLFGRRAGGGLAALSIAVFIAGCRHDVPKEATPDRTVVIESRDGALRGGIAGSVAFFKNVPYAAPPVGALRWRAPQPAPAWSGQRDATRYGNDCLQNRMSWDRANSAQPLAEDCLYLNVWTPAPLQAAARRPVMVWIHGGAYASGSGSSPLSVGDRLAARGVVVVTLNYRLGRFGFFAHPALSAQAGSEPLGNYGLMDQIAALRWVQRNIDRFGGDPGKVTIFGESAGGDAVQLLLLSPQARGLFGKAIVQSGGGRLLMPRLHQDQPGLASAETLGQAFAAKLGLKHPDAAVLRALPAQQVLGDISLVEWEKDRWCSAMIDGSLVQSNVVEGFAAGRQAKVPLLIGANGYEFDALPGIFLSPITKALVPRLGADAGAVVKAYPSKDAFDGGFASDFLFEEPARLIASKASASQPVYLYRFNYVAAAKRSKLAGAPHASDVPYVFGQLSASGDKIGAEDEAMARLIGDYWVAFARDGVPAAAARPPWKPYSPAVDQLYEFSQNGDISMAPAGHPWLDAIDRYVKDNPVLSVAKP